MSVIYTDGSCLSNPDGPSGWAVVLIENNQEYIFCDGVESSTNNRMELTAVIEGLKHAGYRNCTVYSDSQLTINCATNVWRRRANLDLWNEYDTASKDKDIKFIWVKAHAGDKYNEMVDKYAKLEAKKLKEKKNINKYKNVTL